MPEKTSRRGSDCSSKVKIGINQFSYHRYFGEISRWETDPGTRWTVADFIRRAKCFPLDAISFQTCYLRASDLTLIENECRASGLFPIIEWGHPDGLKMGTSPSAVEDLKKWLQFTSALGGKLVRVVAGYPTYRGIEPVALQIARLVPLLRGLCHNAAELGLVLALENHGDFTPLELIELIERVGALNLKATFDTGNCVRLGADLISSTERIARLTEIVHLKDLMILQTSIGDPNASWPSAPLGQGMLDVSAVLRTLQNQQFCGSVVVEMAHMHANWPDEDKAVGESIVWLTSKLKKQG